MSTATRPRSRFRMYHGGLLDTVGDALWLSADADFAAGFAELYDCDYVWRVTLDVNEDDILDLTRLRYRARAVAAALRRESMAAPYPARRDADFPPAVVRAVAALVVRDAGYRAIRIRDSVDWGLGAGRQETVSLYLVDPTAIVRKRKVRLDGHWSFQALRRRPTSNQ